MFGVGLPEGFALVVLIGAIVLYFLPAMIAKSNKHSKAGAILLLNIFVGWTLIGWIACFIWAFIDKENQRQPIDENPDSYAKEYKFQCLVCSKSYMSKDNLILHLRTSHRVKEAEIDQYIYEITDTVKDCPFCRKKIDKEAIKCPYCQEWIGDTKEKSTVKDSKPVQQKDSKGNLKKKCPNCGWLNDPNDKKCIRCEESLF